MFQSAPACERATRVLVHLRRVRERFNPHPRVSGRPPGALALCRRRRVSIRTRV